MKTVSAGLLAHLAAPKKTLATLWQVTRLDGQTFGFTDHDLPINYGGLIYEANSGISPSAVKTSEALNVDNLEAQAFLNSSGVTEPDLMAGLWDGATVWLRIVNYADLTQGEVKMRRGELGEVKLSGQQFVAELRGMMQKLQARITRVALPTCDADLGDARCAVDLTSFTHAFTVTAVASREEFTDTALVQAAVYFDYGRVNWLTGNNAGFSMEIKRHPGSGVIELQLPMPYEIQVGDTGNAIAGCNKLLKVLGGGYTGDCKAKFDNVVNFRGLPEVPGLDELFKTGGV